MERKTVGKAAENAAREYLVAQGMQIVCENFSCRTGELDLICLHKGVMVVVEVRMRSHKNFGGAAGSISRHKRASIIRATKYFLLRCPEYRRFPVRFDVVALDSIDPWDRKRILWIRGAFQDHTRNY